jgi:hypothetical protein
MYNDAKFSLISQFDDTTSSSVGRHIIHTICHSHATAESAALSTAISALALYDDVYRRAEAGVDRETLPFIIQQVISFLFL